MNGMTLRLTQADQASLSRSDHFMNNIGRIRVMDIDREALIRPHASI